MVSHCVSRFPHMKSRLNFHCKSSIGAQQSLRKNRRFDRRRRLLKDNCCLEAAATEAAAEANTGRRGPPPLRPPRIRARAYPRGAPSHAVSRPPRLRLMALPPPPPLYSSSLSPQQQLPQFFKGGKTMETNHHLIIWLGIKMLYFCYVLSIIPVGLSVGRSSAVAASWEPESGRSRWLEDEIFCRRRGQGIVVQVKHYSTNDRHFHIRGDTGLTGRL